ncbi:MAG: pseudouridine synthase [Phycisphaerales bacterium]
MVTHPGVGHEHDTLLNGLWVGSGTGCAQLGVARDWGLVHRLDRDTSGIVAVALSARAYDGMREQFGEREVRKFYLDGSHANPRPEGVINAVQEVVQTGKYTAVKLAKISDAGKPAVTAYRTLAANDLAALVEARPVTGRLHQVRVHGPDQVRDRGGRSTMGRGWRAGVGEAGAARPLAVHRAPGDREALDVRLRSGRRTSRGCCGR